MEDASAIPSSRPQLPARPCPVCGAPVEPLRARAVLLLEDGYRFFDRAECRAGYLSGERHRARSEPVRASASTSASSSDPMLRAVRKRRTPRAQGAVGSSSSEWTAAHAAAPPPPLPLPVLPLGVAAIALLASAFATTWTLVGIAGVLVLAAAALAVFGPLPLRRDAGWLAWATAPAGAAIATLSAVVAFGEGEPARLALAGAALAAASAIARAWLDASAALPLERLLAGLRERMPPRAYAPVEGSSPGAPVGARELDPGRLRVGEEVIAAEGRAIPVDGIVRAGEAYVLPHPGARAPVRRAAGDPVIAGARVVDGALRVLATRVGASRALLRPARFGDPSADDAARITRLAGRGIQFAGLAVLAFGALGLWLGEAGGGLAMRLSAAAGVLLAVPLLAVRRASEEPFVAAGATAAERGIVFASARSLDRAGRVDVVAICTRGTITEGEPEVVEVHAIGGARVEDALALAAGAEASVEGGHPLARAIVRHADAAGIARAGVRRVAAVPGRGLTGVGAAGESIAIGSRQLLLDEGVSVAVGEADALRAEQRGLSIVFVAIERKLRALIALRDADRPGARAAVQRLIDLGAEVLLISGDHRGTVESLARTLDVDHVKAELTPEERGREVRRLREGGNVVAVIGRAGADDAVLGAADVPVVLAAAGGPEGERAIALTGDDVRDAAAALWLASAARRESGRAVAVATAAGAALAVLAISGVAAPGVIALFAIGVDLLALPAAARLLRRIELRLPARG